MVCGVRVSDGPRQYLINKPNPKFAGEISMSNQNLHVLPLAAGSNRGTRVGDHDSGGGCVDEGIAGSC